MMNSDIDTSDAEVERITDNRVDVNLLISDSYWILAMCDTRCDTSVRLSVGKFDSPKGLNMTRGEAAVLGRELLRFAIKGHLREED